MAFIDVDDNVKGIEGTIMQRTCDDNVRAAIGYLLR